MSQVQAELGRGVGSENTSVVVTDIRMPFASMVGFMVKWALASIPALVILAFIVSILGGVITTVVGGLLPGPGK